jgi:hypothetical protein
VFLDTLGRQATAASVGTRLVEFWFKLDRAFGPPGDALDPPLWKIPNKAFSLPLSLSLGPAIC